MTYRYPRQCQGTTETHWILSPADETTQGKCRACRMRSEARAKARRGILKRPPKWTLPKVEPETHPWIERELLRRLRTQALGSDRVDPADLRAIGIDGTLDDIGSDAVVRERIDAFVERRGLEHAGVDRVWQAIEGSRRQEDMT